MLAAKEVGRMTLTRKDAAATLLTLLVVLTYTATHEGWNVALVGASHRCAAVAILLLGTFTCGLGDPSRSDGGLATKVCATLGMLALALGALAIATGSLTLLSLLVVGIVALWALTTLRHATHRTPTPLTT